ncbi:MAG: hypothetical protein ABIN58_09470, partial [candidate division WOR-3 bacterium]
LLQHVVRGNWGFIVVRLTEAGARNLGLMFGLLLPILLMGLPELYPWARPAEIAHDPIWQRKVWWLNREFFVFRAVFYFVVWGLFAYPILKWSSEQDQTGDLSLAKRRMNLAAPGIVFFVLMNTFAFTDWTMSLEREWYSTIHGFLYVVSGGLAALSFATLLLLWFAQREPFSEVTVPSRLRDIGNLMLTLTVLWTYMAFAQLLIQWSGNLPEEITYYLDRSQGIWKVGGVLLILFQFLLPFLALLSSRTKRTPLLLGLVAALILLMRVVDTFWQIIPSFHRQGAPLLLTDFAALFFIGGLWLVLYVRHLKQRSLLPLHEPRLQEAYEHG